MIELPRWFRILKAWQTRRYGLTLPFLIGALDGESRVGEPLDEVARLLVAFRDEAPEDHFVLVARCYNISEIVAALGVGKPPNRGLPIFSEVQEREALFVEASIFADAAETTVNSAAMGLAREYANQIKSGNYSIESGVWRPFSSKDLSFIASID